MMKIILSTVLIAFGIIAPISHFAAGMFMAISGAYLMSVWFPEETKREMRLTIATAMMVATLLSIAHQSWPMLAAWPVQLVMAVGGLLSRHLVMLFNKIGLALGEKASEYLDKIGPKS
jgi:hypothetical protein